MGQNGLQDVGMPWFGRILFGEAQFGPFGDSSVDNLRAGPHEGPHEILDPVGGCLLEVRGHIRHPSNAGNRRGVEPGLAGKGR